MARIQKKKLKVDKSDAATWYLWYQRDAGADVGAWLAEIDAGNVDQFAQSSEPEIEIPDIEGDFDFAVALADDAGNISDPVTFGAWTAVPLDLSPPPAATGGTIEDVA